MAPPPFFGKEYGDDGSILLTGSQSKLVAYHGGQVGVRNAATYGPFSGHYGQAGNHQLAVATDTIWAR